MRHALSLCVIAASCSWPSEPPAHPAPDAPLPIEKASKAEDLNDEGRAALARGQLDAAAASFAKAITLDPKNCESRSLQIRTLEQQGKSSDAQRADYARVCPSAAKAPP